MCCFMYSSGKSAVVSVVIIKFLIGPPCVLSKSTQVKQLQLSVLTDTKLVFFIIYDAHKKWKKKLRVFLLNEHKKLKNALQQKITEV